MKSKQRESIDSQNPPDALVPTLERDNLSKEFSDGLQDFCERRANGIHAVFMQGLLQIVERISALGMNPPPIQQRPLSSLAEGGESVTSAGPDRATNFFPRRANIWYSRHQARKRPVRRPLRFAANT
jgi:hypothetical protein